MSEGEKLGQGLHLAMSAAGWARERLTHPCLRAGRLKGRAGPGRLAREGAEQVGVEPGDANHARAKRGAERRRELLAVLGDQG
ncbi:MAG: hypothetical protein JNK82_33815 [Myxococcaceae bacterium]|nr:hypothetical protein [Myxococcaceae bacterium]